MAIFSRAAGADVEPRLAALLLETPGAGVDERRWRRARRTMQDLSDTLAKVPPAELDGTVGKHGWAQGIKESELAAALLALGFPDRVGQLQRGKTNTFSLGNGRVAAFASDKEPLATNAYIVAASIDGSDKRSARVWLAAGLSEATMMHVLGADGAGVIVTQDETFLAPSDGVWLCAWMVSVVCLCCVCERVSGCTDASMAP